MSKAKALKKPAEYTEEEVAAVIKIQCLARKRQAWLRVMILVRQTYVKVLDRLNNEYKYKNKMTGAVDFDKPRLLGKKDLPEPRTFVCPMDYDPGDTYGVDGFAFVVTCSEFSSDKLPEIGLPAVNDHKEITDLFSHEFITKMRGENVVSLHNPSRKEFMNGLETLEKVVQANGFLVVYICTHFMTLWGAPEKQLGSRDNVHTYIATNDTDYRQVDAVARTSISLNTLIAGINKCRTNRRVVIANYGHQKYTPPSLLGSKILYPHHNMLTALATHANCAVIGSCSMGMKATDVIDRNPILVEELRSQYRPYDTQRHRHGHGHDKHDKSKKEEMKDETKNKDGRRGHQQQKRGATNFIPNFAAKKELEHVEAMKTPEQLAKEQHDSDLHKARMKLKELKSRPWWKRKKKLTDMGDFPEDEAFEEWEEEQRIEAILSQGIDPEKHLVTRNELVFKLRAEWKLQKLKVLKSDNMPEELMPKWEAKLPEEGFEDFEEKKFMQALRDVEGKYVCTMPTVDDYDERDRKVKIWGLKQVFDRPRNFIQQKFRDATIKNAESPRQMSISDERRTAFGKAVAEALNGEASNTKDEFVTARRLFECIYKKVQAAANDAEIVAIAEAQVRLKQVEKDFKKNVKTVTKKDVDKAKIMPKLAQTPMLVVPSGEIGEDVADYPVSFTCGVPPSPERAFILRSVGNSVTIEWYNPPFDGVQGNRYSVYMKGETRNFSRWSPVPGSNDIITNKFTIKDIPGGIPFQFAVRAGNNGGWGERSEPSQRISAGEDEAPIELEVRWKRLGQGGPLSIIDFLQLHKFNRWEYSMGFSKLIDVAQKAQGFKRDFQMKIAQLCMHALDIFDGDVEIVAKSFTLAGYALVSKNIRPIRAYVIQEGIADTAHKYMESHRDDSTMIKSISWLRSKLPKNIKPNPVIIYEDDKVHEVFEKEEVDEEQQEADESLLRALKKVSM